MKRLISQYITAQPSRRPLRIFASDPMQARTPGNRITIDIPNEPVTPGPVGSRFEVIDYDGANDCFYPPVDLNDRAILMLNGLEPTESDPRFHQQMVYAVAMRTLENFERALGRTLHFYKPGFGYKLRLFPHAFHGANAYFDPEQNGILFGYFCADRKDPGPNLPGQIVYTCLSHDIIVHELTHAIINRLRKNFLEPTNPDVLAFHEGFADIVALFQHFTFKEFLTDAIQKTHTDIRTGKSLVELARQFGYATGANQALRSAINVDKNNNPKRLSPDILEVHDRGAILVAAVFDGFFNSYQKSIADLIRIATFGSGILPAGDMHPDLVNRVASEAAHIAQSMLNICIRAFDYMPPVDITFGDYLRALVTADYEVFPDDGKGFRGAIIEGFRTRGIYPEGVTSLAEEALIWDDVQSKNLYLSNSNIDLANEIYRASVSYNINSSTGMFEAGRKPEDFGGFSAADEGERNERLAKSLHEFATSNAVELDLDPKKKIQVLGFHPIFRISDGGHMLTELVVQFQQHDDSYKEKLGGLVLRGGTTIVAGTDGHVRYIVSKPLPTAGNEPARKTGLLRLDQQRAYLGAVDMSDPRMAYGRSDFTTERARLRMKLASLHQGGM